MFKLAVVASLFALALAQDPNGPTTTCFSEIQNAHAGDCSNFVQEFCQEVSGQTILQREWAGKCIDNAPGQTVSCQFYAYNTRDDNNPPSAPYCENVINAIIHDCDGGGYGRAGSETAAYTFIVDPDYRSCGDGITADHH